MKVASRPAPRATPIELEAGVPLFLDQLITTLRSEEASSGTPSDHQIGRSAAKHGKALQKMGVSANGGEINVRNIAGRGCIFTIELPGLPLDAVGPPDVAEVAEVGARGGATP